MPGPLYGRDLLSIRDLSSEEVWLVIETARQMKLRYYAGERIIPMLKGKTIALIFEKPSTRTRVSMEVAALQLGATPLTFRRDELQLARGEPIKDTARVLSRYVDAIAARVFKHESLEEMAAYASVPVINMLSDLEHPLQALADALTIYEKKGHIKGIKVVYVGDGRNNVAHSLLLVIAKLGGHIVISSPKELTPRKDILEAAQLAAKETGATIELIEDPAEAVRGADVVYTDVWVSMGEESLAEERRRLLQRYQVNEKLMSLASNNAIFMHCLPAHRGEEVTEEVIEGPWSVVWDQAENRLHAQKAVLALILAP
ncbi:ornithine carbamoyltransferase [Hyperthermus butylicus]|uniref:Ornithine carbamoyltransferase n=1 Tax=Hyperthermus butylicus (strain DSM 5456 / JCM 9403 / PLM1-5) TaxID=415426 RepID=OTC_HYPBU|nr:ornithine carbamoyltransferase [Hyperthermus butylicus]A2BM26.1 RecName: Full=Ornithine carbamoyltransferase; Short=OTCase [Hyperthermus butylicus DSM 5456]ABM81037.1 Ornithine carbamoyltransferase [Hyperthermus butylicus DSM 5456]